MNSGMVIARVTASTKRRRRGTHQMYRVAPEDSLKVADTRRAASRLPSRRETSETLTVGVDRRAARPGGTCATPRSGRNGETNAKRRAAAHRALDGHLAAVVLDDGTGNGQPQTEAAAVGGPRDATTIEALEDPWDLVGRDTGACAGDGGNDRRAFGRGIDDDLTPGRGELHRVVEHVGEHQDGEPFLAPAGPRQRLRRVDGDRDAPTFGLRREPPEHLVESAVQTPDLVRLGRARKPSPQASLADLSRPTDDAIDRTKGAPGQEHPDQPDPDQDAHGHAGKQEPRRAKNGVRVVERHRHLNGVAGTRRVDR